jgi:hypothetical protein
MAGPGMTQLVRWLLQDRGGALSADHEVRLDDRSWQFEAFADLDRYLRRYAVPTAWPTNGDCGRGWPLNSRARSRSNNRGSG